MVDSYVFKPGLMPTVAFIILFSALIMLGNWQLDRAGQKETIHVDYLSKKQQPPLDLNLFRTGDVFDDIIWRKGEVTGKFSQDGHVLLDNQVYKGVPGYFLYTPFLLESETRQLLVNRGWIAASAYRDIIPEIKTPTTRLTLSGTIKLSPLTGLVLGDNLIESFPGNVKRVQRLVLDSSETKEGLTLMPVILRLDGESSYGYNRDWAEAGSGKERHQGYAFQWFAMAGVLLVIYILVNMKKIEKNE